MKRSNWIVAGFMVVALWACGGETPLLVGLVGDLPASGGGVDSGFRNGATLAVADINDASGVNGHPLELVVENDNGDPGLVPRLDETLIGKNVVALVGHNTSATTEAALPLVNRHKVLLMGPEATSSQFAGKRDYFVRNEVRESAFAEALADYAVQTLRLKSVGAILDEKNTPFSRPFFDAFKAKMQASGATAEVVSSFRYLDSGETARRVASFLARGGQAVLLVSNGEDTRNLAQLVRRVRDDVPLLGTPWAMPPSGAYNLGPLPEHLIFPCTWDPDSTAPNYFAFQKAYMSRFNHPVDYHAVHAYEAISILARALVKTKGKSADLPSTIAAIGRFEGLQGPIQIDVFGDCQREVSILTVINGVPRRLRAPEAGKPTPAPTPAAGKPAPAPAAGKPTAK